MTTKFEFNDQISNNSIHKIHRNICICVVVVFVVGRCLHSRNIRSKNSQLNERNKKKKTKQQQQAIPDFECVTNMFQYNIINQPTPSACYKTR